MISSLIIRQPNPVILQLHLTFLCISLSENFGNKINNDKMINGVSLSQIEDVNLTQLSHYRRIAQVENGTYSRISQLDP